MKITLQSGHCWLNFDNGYILSIFNGFGSHTENYFNFEKYNKIIKNKDITAKWVSEEVEIAILDNSENFVTDEILNCGDMVHTVDLKKLIEIINILNNK